MLGKIERNDVLNLIGGFLAVYGGVAFLCFIWLVQTWGYAAPTSPEPASGYLYPHNEHGRITYFSAFQATSCVLLFSSSIPLGFLVIYLSPKRNVVVRRTMLAVSARWDQDDPKKIQRVGFWLGALAAPIVVFVIGPTLVKWLNAAGIVWSLG